MHMHTYAKPVSPLFLEKSLLISTIWHILFYAYEPEEFKWLLSHSGLELEMVLLKIKIYSPYLFWRVCILLDASELNSFLNQHN